MSLDLLHVANDRRYAPLPLMVYSRPTAAELRSLRCKLQHANWEQFL